MIHVSAHIKYTSSLTLSDYQELELELEQLVKQSTNQQPLMKSRKWKMTEKIRNKQHESDSYEANDN